MMEGDKENDCFEPPGVTAPPVGHLKQRLDDIFAEVTNNLPSIDLEFSDVSINCIWRAIILTHCIQAMVAQSWHVT